MCACDLETRQLYEKKKTYPVLLSLLLLLLLLLRINYTVFAKRVNCYNYYNYRQLAIMADYNVLRINARVSVDNCFFRVPSYNDNAFSGCVSECTLSPVFL